MTHFLGKHTTFHPVRFRMDWNIYRRLLPSAFPTGLTELCNGLMIFLFNHTILRCIGTDGLVAYTIIAYSNTLVINITMASARVASRSLASRTDGETVNLSASSYAMGCAPCAALPPFASQRCFWQHRLW